MPQGKHNEGAKETVLLRQAAPKYNFSARKLPKEPTKKVSSEKTDSVASSSASLITQLALKTDNAKTKPIAVVEASLQLLQNTSERNVKSEAAAQALPVLNTLNHYSSTQNLATNARNYSSRSDCQNIPDGVSRSLPVSIPESSPTQNLSVSHYQQQLVNAVTPRNLSAAAVPQTIVQRNAAMFVADKQNLCEEERCQHLQHERDQLQKELDIQLQVNSELKRLLVASVGDDLSQRVERLCRDRAQLSLDLGGVSKKMSEEYENLDKVSIQADMWRSKYLASRVMIEELGNARAFYALQCHDTHDALQQLLNERHELRTNLLETHRILQQMKSAFDPLNAQCSSTLRSTSVLELSRCCQQLAEAMRFRLLPAHVAVNIDLETDETTTWVNSVTRAEQFAHEVLSRPTDPPGSLQSGSSRLLPLKAATTTVADLQICRFHPNTRHDNLTYNCCAHCKGEINVV